ncbi:hypothetical protein BC938DRAFT_471325 [Jimgerdemannia flammicorona]|uniref:Uncharacterized protein n=1 Tax=Jimgerdemannia flammicorona TaxID=994334 RepID=A0A433QUN5_9FUNG|nr:hypothetical protein BC938DRAFT_471325 [Jimgerdemannia flammicorona]
MGLNIHDLQSHKLPHPLRSHRIPPLHDIGQQYGTIHSQNEYSGHKSLRRGRHAVRYVVVSVLRRVDVVPGIGRRGLRKAERSAGVKGVHEFCVPRTEATVFDQGDDRGRVVRHYVDDPVVVFFHGDCGILIVEEAPVALGRVIDHSSLKEVRCAWTAVRAHSGGRDQAQGREQAPHATARGDHDDGVGASGPTGSSWTRRRKKKKKATSIPCGFYGRLGVGPDNEPGSEHLIACATKDKRNLLSHPTVIPSLLGSMFTTMSIGMAKDG